MTNAITCSSELMTNYLNASIMDADAAFEALQDNLGNALLFSVGTDGIFYATRETPVNNSAAAAGSANGWERLDLSSAVLNQDFPGSLPVCKTIAVNQNFTDSTISLAMVITVNGSDVLFLSLGNSASDTSWLSAPVWTQCPYNYCPVRGEAPVPPDPLNIVKVFIDESENGQFVVTDIVQGPDIQRYYILQTSSGPLWNLHALAIDLSPDAPYSSCIGRAHGSQVDGMYTFGQVDDAVQFMYCPLWNPFGNAPPSPTLLVLPSGSDPAIPLLPQAMAAFRNGNADLSTDLFVTATGAADSGCLFYLSSAVSGHTVNAANVLNNPLFIDVVELYADLNDGIVTVWGLNNANIIFYTSCPYTDITEGNWSVPVTLLTGVDMVSPYVNRMNNGNTIFAVGGNDLTQLSKSPSTGLWTKTQVSLPAPVGGSAPVSFSSYTTRIQLTDGNNQPVANATLQISAATRTGYYVNNLYTVLDTNAISITTDATGVITLIESVKKLQATRITVSEVGGTTVTINPMDTPFSKIVELNSVSALQNAAITNGDGSTKPLVPTGVSTADLQAVATSNTDLKSAYAALQSSTPEFLYHRFANHDKYILAGYENALLMDVGDIFSWLESGIESVVSIVQNEVTGIWNFIATIAGKIYQGVLDCVEKVVGAVEWLYNAIKTAIEDLIAFLEFLFEWKDILATHNVLKNVFTQYVAYAIGNMTADKAMLASVFSTIKQDINQWADVPGFNQTPSSTGASNTPIPAQNSAPANLGVHHFQGNAGSVSSGYAPPAPSPGIFDDLLNFLEGEEAIAAATLAAAGNVIAQFGTLSLTQILQQLIAILADALVDVTEQLLVLLIDVIILASDGVMDLLTAGIDIPVLSWLYKEVSGNDLSFLDLICLIAAIPATLVYKSVKDEAPFPHGDALTDSLIGATSFAAVQAIFQTSTDERVGALEPGAVIEGKALAVFGAISGFCALIGTQAMLFISNANPKPKSTLAFLGGVANVFYVSPDIPSMMYQGLRWDQKMNGILTDICILKGFTLDVIYAGTTGAKICEVLLNTIWNVPVVVNIVENPNWEVTSPSLIEDSISNFAFNIGGMLTLNVDNPEVKTAQFVMMETYGIYAMFGGLINA